MEYNTYLNSCLQRCKIIRWDDSCMPIAFYIAPFRWYKDKENAYKYIKMVKDACELWSKASEGKIRFNFVNTLNESQINLDWKRVDRESLGVCYYNFDTKGRLYSAEVQIGLSDGLLHAKYEDEKEVFHTIVHEIGHALGLQHSIYKNDIMYVPHQFGIINASTRDINTLKWLYKFPAGKNIKDFFKQQDLPEDYNIDQFIQEKESKKIKTTTSKFKGVLTKSNNIDSKKLKEEQELLADINKYNLSLQQISLSSKVTNYIKKSLIKDKD